MSKILVETMTRYAVAQHNAHNERETRRMLGLWVSELEPITMWGRDGIVRGLTAKGHDRAYVSAEPPWWIKDAVQHPMCRCAAGPPSPEFIKEIMNAS